MHEGFFPFACGLRATCNGCFIVQLSGPSRDLTPTSKARVAYCQGIQLL